MRTTLTLDDHLAAELQRRARHSGRPFRQVVNEAIRRGLQEARTAPARAYSLQASAMGGVRAGVDLVKARALADAMEDAAIAAELELRK